MVHIMEHGVLEDAVAEKVCVIRTFALIRREEWFLDGGTAEHSKGEMSCDNIATYTTI